MVDAEEENPKRREEEQWRGGKDTFSINVLVLLKLSSDGMVNYIMILQK